MTDTTTIAPVVREITVHAPRATCFDVFVNRLDTWWPYEHHIGEDREIVAFHVDPRPGGRMWDVDTKGGENHWATVLELDPPGRFLFAWHVQGDWTCDTDPEKQSEVELTFVAVGEEETRVRLEHRGIERHGGGAEGLAGAVGSPGGWPGMLVRFADVCEGRDPSPLPAGPTDA